MTLGRLILPALRWQASTGFSHEEPAIEEALGVGAGGFILFGGTAQSVRALTAELTRRAGRPLLIASDLERGAGQQVEGLTELPPPLALAALEDLDAVRWAGAVTGSEARSVGINWVFAPVADLDILAENPIVQTRAFGADPELVARSVRAWIEGCQSAGALACAKHYPGHGRTARDSHITLPEVDASADELGADERPFAEAVQAGVASLMTAHVAYPALDPSGVAATLSPPILGRLRDGLGFDGLVVSDALVMEGAIAGRSEGNAAVEAVRAGVDLLLYPKDVRGVRAALDAAVATGRLPAARVAEAQRRYDAALARVARTAPTAPRGPYDSADRLADALLDQGLLRGKVRRLTAPLDVVVLDDDLGGPYPPSATGYVEAELARRGLAGSGGSRVVLVFAEPRAWKGRAGLGASTRDALAREAPGAALVVLFGHPRLAAEIPEPAPVLVAWHRQRLMQEAAARWLAART
jgi:beta-glucosidase